MDELKIINRKIRNLVVEVCFATFIFTLAFSLWINPNTTMAAFAESNGNQTVLLQEVKPLKLENIYPISDSKAINNNNKGLFKLINNANVNSKYSIIYRIHNSSTLDYNFLKYQLIIDDNSYVDFLYNLQFNEENNCVDFILHNGEIDKNSEKTFEYTMWLDSEVGNEAQNKVLSAEFVVKSYGTELSIR
ncbi:MAG: hypothetical protein E7166_05250 [Firmicutes bacterium]|nr:hypothetical protein [Bacillota bacterium]